jgi:hypothetical protein
VIGLNGLVLKLIALTTMIIDHYGAIFQPSEMTFRMIGRLAFPIYCFLLVEGFIHTSNIKKYAFRLLAFALISEIPFDYAFYRGIHWGHQNIFFTLFIGLLAMYFIDRKDVQESASPLIAVGAAAAATFLATDYRFIGIIYILVFYYSRNLPPVRRMSLVAGIIFLTNLVSTGWIQQYSLLSLPVLLTYNNKPGPKIKPLQYAFYWAYPLHLALFALVVLGYLSL